MSSVPPRPLSVEEISVELTMRLRREEEALEYLARNYIGGMIEPIKAHVIEQELRWISALREAAEFYRSACRLPAPLRLMMTLPADPEPCVESSVSASNGGASR